SRKRFSLTLTIPKPPDTQRRQSRATAQSRSRSARRARRSRNVAVNPPTSDSSLLREQGGFMSTFRGRRIAACAAMLAATVALAACGSKTGEASSSSSGAVADTSGDTIKVGLLNSLSGTMAISEVTVRDSLKLAVDEINSAGGVLGKQLAPVSEDGASDWPTFAEKAQKLISQDRVAAVFGCWTSASRKA